MTAAFALAPALDASTHEVGDLPLSRVLLVNDARYPWLILVPRRTGASELIDLSPADHRALSDEIRIACFALRELHRPDKLNVAALGNVVPQLHVHVIARFRDDPAWPAPVWGTGPAPPYPAEVAVQRLNDLRGALRMLPR